MAAQHAAYWCAGAMIVIAQAWVESARAAFIADASLRSASVAMARGLLQLLRRPFSTLFAYLLVTLIGFALALSLGLARADAAVLESRAMAAQHAAYWCAGAMIVIVQAWVESARAAFIADASLRSASVAMARGLLQLLRRPFSTLFAYLLVTLIGFALALSLGLARVHTLAVGAQGLLLGLAISTLVMVVLGWMRTARLFALAEVARSLGGARRSGF